MIVEVENDNERNDNRTFTVIATVGDDVTPCRNPDY